jgi:hypothetical protein
MSVRSRHCPALVRFVPFALGVVALATGCGGGGGGGASPAVPGGGGAGPTASPSPGATPSSTPTVSSLGRQIYVVIGDDGPYVPQAKFRRAPGRAASALKPRSGGRRSPLDTAFAYGVVSFPVTANGETPAATGFSIDPSIEQFPQAIALDPSGNIFVLGPSPANQQVGHPSGGPNFTLLEYPPTGNGGTPIGTIAGAPNDFGAVRFAFGPDGTLYVAQSDGSVNAPGSILTWPPGARGNAAPGAIGGPGINVPTEVAVENEGPDVTPFVSIFAPGASGQTLQTTFTTNVGNANFGTTGFGLPEGLAVDGAGNVFVADYLNGFVYKFATPGPGLNQTLVPTAIIGAPVLGRVSSIALDASGTLYALNTTTIYVFAPGSGTSTAPSATITSGSLNYPQQITVNP